MKQSLLILLVGTISMMLNAQQTDESLSDYDFLSPVGFAAIDGDGFTGPTTGGGQISASENIVTINGMDDFEKLVQLLYDRIRAYRNQAVHGTARYAPLIIILEEGVYTEGPEIPNTGSVWGKSMMSIEEQGDLTIIGRGEVIMKFGFNVKRSRNIIFRNLIFYDYYDDGINIGGAESHHVWVDHCTFGHPSALPSDKNHPDGGVDIKDGASYITVSWCLFRNSWKTGLVGHSDNNESRDAGRLKTTFYMNHYHNTNSRHPRVRFGQVHVLNNFYEGVLNYGIAAAYKAEVVAEGNFFLNTTWPMYADRTSTDFAAVYGPWSSETGNKPAFGLKQFNNQYDDSGLSKVYTSANINTERLNPGGKSIIFDELNHDEVFDPQTYYHYLPVAVASVPDLVRSFAGAGKVNFFNTTSLPAASYTGGPLQLYPNPVKDQATVITSQPGLLTIRDLTGTTVYQRKIDSGSTTIPINSPGFKQGVFLVSLQTASGVSSIKMVIQ